MKLVNMASISNSRVPATLASLGWSGLLLIALSATGMLRSYGAPSGSTLSASRFELTNSAGKVVGEFGLTAETESPYLLLRDSSGRPSVQVSASDSGGAVTILHPGTKTAAAILTLTTPGNPVCHLNDREGNQLVALQATDQGTFLTLAKKGSKPGLVAGVAPTPFLLLMKTADDLGVRLSASPESSGMEIKGAGNESRIHASVTKGDKASVCVTANANSARSCLER